MPGEAVEAAGGEEVCERNVSSLLSKVLRPMDHDGGRQIDLNGQCFDAPIQESDGYLQAQLLLLE